MDAEMSENERPCWNMDGVRFVQLIVGPSPFDKTQTLMALDADGEVWIYDADGHGWDMWEKMSVTEGGNG